MTDRQDLPGTDRQERSIPPVAGTGMDKDKLFWLAMIVLLLVAGAVAVWFNFFGADNGPDKIVKQRPVQYNRERITRLDIPKTAPKATPAVHHEPQPQAPAAQAKTVPKQERHHEAARRQRELEKRWAAPLVIYDAMDRHQDSDGAAVAATQANRLNHLTRLQERLIEKASDLAGGHSASTGLMGDSASTYKSVKGYARASFMTPEQRRYTVTEGTMISAVLETAINSNLPGKLRATVDEDVYSYDGRTLLIEKGTTAIGEYQSGLKQSQVRLFAIWHRMLTPRGIDVQFQSPGTDPLGRSGLSGWVDTHFWQRFGSSVMLSIIGAYTARQASKETTNNQIIAQSVSENFNRSSEIALENAINIPPTLKKNQGELIKIFVAQDINFKDAYLLSRRQAKDGIYDE
jgi:type IV secretion system protein VirB10